MRRKLSENLFIYQYKRVIKRAEAYDGPSADLWFTIVFGTHAI